MDVYKSYVTRGESGCKEY